jgi:hypothetical protein
MSLSASLSLAAFTEFLLLLGMYFLNSLFFLRICEALIGRRPQIAAGFATIELTSAASSAAVLEPGQTLVPKAPVATIQGCEKSEGKQSSS